MVSSTSLAELKFSNLKDLGYVERGPHVCIFIAIKVGIRGEQTVIADHNEFIWMNTYDTNTHNKLNRISTTEMPSSPFLSLFLQRITAILTSNIIN